MSDHIMFVILDHIMLYHIISYYRAFAHCAQV